jgi:hypothetical protein
MVEGVKQAESGDALVIRMVETAGREVTAAAVLTGMLAEQIRFRPYEIKTFKVTRDGTWTPVNLMEESLE